MIAYFLMIRSCLLLGLCRNVAGENGRLSSLLVPPGGRFPAARSDVCIRRLVVVGT